MYHPPMARVVPRLIWLVVLVCSVQLQAAPAAWQDDHQPHPKESWNSERAAHLLERAGFDRTLRSADVADLVSIFPTSPEFRGQTHFR
jgi:hypothetical protein